MLDAHPVLSRRLVVFGVLILPFAPQMALAAPGPLTFAVFRKGVQIGEHHMSFAGAPGAITATTNVLMRVKLGPVTVFRYTHNAVERWAADRFAELETRTDSNGKREQVEAEKTGSAVTIRTAKGQIQAAAATSPLTHWNPKAFAGPLFNPQTGKLLKVSVSRPDPRQWSVRGEAEIDDTYDANGVWTGLKGKLEDGSPIEYRRI